MPPQTHAEQPRQAQPASDTVPGTTVPGPGVRPAGLARVPPVPAARRRRRRRGRARGRGGRRRRLRGHPADGRGQAGGRQAGGRGQAAAAPKASGEPLVVYLRDTSTGEFEVFNGTRQVRVRNPALVAQLLDGLQTAQ